MKAEEITCINIKDKASLNIKKSQKCIQIFNKDGIYSDKNENDKNEKHSSSISIKNRIKQWFTNDPNKKHFYNQTWFFILIIGILFCVGCAIMLWVVFA